MSRIVSGKVLTLLLVSMIALAFNVQRVESSAIGWSKTYGGTGDDRAYSVVQTGDWHAIAGSKSVAGSYDFWLIKTDENGIIPEFPTLLILPLFVALTMLAILFAKKRFPRKL